MQRTFGLGLCLTTLSLAACADLNGPPHTIGARGPVGKTSLSDLASGDDHDQVTAAQIAKSRIDDRRNAHVPAGMIKRFYDAELAAKRIDDAHLTYGDLAVIPPTALPEPAAAVAAVTKQNALAAALAEAEFQAQLADATLRGVTPPTRVARVPAPPPSLVFRDYYRQQQDRMLDTGFTLTYAYCSDFFLSQGRRQTALLTLRDAVATAGSLAVGALALVNFQSPATQSTVLAVVGLGTSAATAGIDIYTQRFLFGAENIDAVRDLTLKAMNAHQGDIHSKSGSYAYDDVVKALLDDQAICTPRHIALLARRAIVEATVVVKNGAGDLAVQSDANVIALLTTTLKLPKPMTDEELLGLWWLATDAKEDEAVMLRAKYWTTLPDEPSASTTRLLKSLSAAKQEALNGQITAKRLAILEAKNSKTADDKKQIETLKAKQSAVPDPAATIAGREGVIGTAAATQASLSTPASTTIGPHYDTRSSVDVGAAPPR